MTDGRFQNRYQPLSVAKHPQCRVHNPNERDNHRTNRGHRQAMRDFRKGVRHGFTLAADAICNGPALTTQTSCMPSKKHQPAANKSG